MPLEVEGRIAITHEEPFKIELARGQKGSYGWTVTVHTVTSDGAIALVADIDAKLQAQFPTNGNGSP